MKTLFAFISLFLIFSSGSLGQDLEIICDSDYSEECFVFPGGNDPYYFESPTVSGGCEPYEWEIWDEFYHYGCYYESIDYWQVVDACGDTVQCHSVHHVEDTSPPLVYDYFEGYLSCSYFYVVSEPGEEVEYELYPFAYDPYSGITPDDFYFYECNPLEDYYIQEEDQAFYSVELISYGGCGTAAHLNITFGDACGNVGTHSFSYTPAGEYCDDPNSCNYGTYGPDDLGDGIGNGEGCAINPGDACFYQETGSFGNINSDCDCQILGCSDSLACNYLEGTTEDDGSCCYGNCGCMDETAVNFDPSYVCPLDSCSYLLSGMVFNDLNANGYMNGNEQGLSFIPLLIEPGGIEVLTNDQGEYSVAVPPGSYSITATPSEAFPFITTTNPRTRTVYSYNATVQDIGLSINEPLHAVCVDLYPSGNGFLCNDYSTHNICFRNMGNVPINGIVELEYDVLFQNHQEITPIDSVNENSVYMSFEDLQPGEMYFYDVSLLTPTVDHIGEYVTSVAKVYGFYEGEEVAYGQQELNMEIACAYDPNDKQAFPLGYTDQHWLLPETEQEFLVRFQNTGNAPAQDIRIIDTLDGNWDLSTLRIVANSHSVMTTIDPVLRTVDFYFENIQLPDSVNNEPDSHGMISYKITPLPNVEIGTELRNTAYIYFDNNEPIVTNTTWTAIHECGGEAQFSFESTLDCEGSALDLMVLYPHLETRNWFLNDNFISNSYNQYFLFDELGEYTVRFEVENPLCEDEYEFIHIVDNLTSGEYCDGDLDQNCRIGVSDLGLFLSEFGCIGGDCISDLNGDYAGTIQDLALLLTLLGRNCGE